MGDITLDGYQELKRKLAELGHGGDVAWAQAVTAPATADAFAREYAFVVCNSGMRSTVAVGIYRRVRLALDGGIPVAGVFGHPGKAAAIQRVWDQRDVFFRGFRDTDDVVAFLQTLPWIGPITKWHLAKNFGVDCVKPDRWLERLADGAGTTPHDLCAVLALASGDRIGTVDVVLWRAASLGLLDDILNRGRLSAITDGTHG